MNPETYTCDSCGYETDREPLTLCEDCDGSKAEEAAAQRYKKLTALAGAAAHLYATSDGRLRKAMDELNAFLEHSK